MAVVLMKMGFKWLQFCVMHSLHNAINDKEIAMLQYFESVVESGNT